MVESKFDVFFMSKKYKKVLMKEIFLNYKQGHENNLNFMLDY